VARKREKPPADVGILLCDCAGTLNNRLDFDRLAKQLAKLPDVVAVKTRSQLCRFRESRAAVSALAGDGAKRLVIAACGMEMLGESVHQAIKPARINFGLVWCVNIREQCAWVDRDRKSATAGAIDQITAAVRRVRLQERIRSNKTNMNQDVVVLGDGVAGMHSAIALARLGHRVSLVHKGDKLGGRAAAMPEFYAYMDTDAAGSTAAVLAGLDRLVDQVIDDDRITVYGGSSLKSTEGELGNFSIVIETTGTVRTISAGGIVLAMEARDELPFQCTHAGVDRTRCTDLAGLARIVRSANVPSRVAVVIDILAEQGREVTGMALSAAELLAGRFRTDVKIYCHHVRVAASGLENLYRRARNAGVVVTKYQAKPVISEQGGKVIVSAEDPVAGVVISDEFDLVVMADVRSRPGLVEGMIDHLRPAPDGALQYNNIWLLPASVNIPGVFAVGDCRGDGELRDAITDASAVAGEIHELLKNKTITIPDDPAVVDPDKCVLCLTCLRICPHGAISIDTDKQSASVSPVACQRCGICAAECPAQAIQLTRYTDDQITAEIGGTPQITVFACENSAIPAAVSAGSSGLAYDANISIIRVPCAGKIDMRHVLAAFEDGAEKVIILACHPESCRYLTGASRAEKRVQRMQNALERAGYDSSRLCFHGLAAIEGHKFVDYINDAVNGVKT